jgi:multidrug efflux pump subunit AcrA (membrane-fusion protein)
MDNRETNYRPGERVGAALPLKGEAASLTVPWSAVVFDYHGGSWVYEAAADHTYIRRRVTVRFVKDAIAVLESGPPPGTKVVTAGAAELFGTEAGFSK